MLTQRILPAPSNRWSDSVASERLQSRRDRRALRGRQNEALGQHPDCVMTFYFMVSGQLAVIFPVNDDLGVWLAAPAEVQEACHFQNHHPGMGHLLIAHA